jgi:HlyD family secretion protein
MPILQLKGKDKGEERPQDDVVLSAMDRRIERRFITPKRAAIALGVLLLVAVSVYGYVEFGLRRTLSVDSERLTVSKVEYGTFHEYIPVTGNVVPRTTVYLDTVEGGQITSVRVEEGALVKAGDLLVTFKNTNLELQVINAEAQLTEQMNGLNTTRLNFEQSRLRNQSNLAELEYQIDRLQRDLKRRKPLVATGGATQSQIDDLEAELARDQRQLGPAQEAVQIDAEFSKNQMKQMGDALDAMNKSLEITHSNLNNLMITAPISGQLTQLDANVGASKSPGERIGQIDELNAFKVSAFIDEFYLSRVTTGQTASVDIDGKTYDLQVVKVYPDVKDRQFQVDLTFTGDQPALRRGQTVRMRLEIGQPADTLVLSNGAFYDDTGGQWVFVVDPSGNFAERRTVRFGRRNPEGIEVLEGLRRGEEVITSSYENLMTFDRIQFNKSGS